MPLTFMCYSADSPSFPPPPPPPYQQAIHNQFTGTLNGNQLNVTILPCIYVPTPAPAGTAWSIKISISLPKSLGPTTGTVAVYQDTTPLIDCSSGTVTTGSLAMTPRATSTDRDQDGCTNWEELGPTHTIGGLRDPFNVWDFFDTPDDTNTTLSAAITATAAPPFTITVASSSAFPAAPDTLSFFIDNEKFVYDTKPTTTSFHVTARAVDGTTAAQHNAGAPVVRNVRDKIILIDDIIRVVNRYFASGDPTINPLSPPPLAPAYHTAFDRGPAVGPNDWNLGPADGQILIDDIVAVVDQYFDDCSVAP